MNRPYLRALLTSAALAAAIALGACNPDGLSPDGRALAPLSEKMLATIEDKQMDKDSPILVRLFKEESELEVWKKNRDGQFALLKTYPICRWSGDLGPKKKEGDRQAPEGFYTISPGQMNPRSNYYLAFNTGYPNAYDRAWGYTGSELMVHGDCSSRGCYAMTDEQIQEIYALARESFFGGQKDFQLQAFPFRMTALNMAKHRNNPSFAFWKMIKEGYDNFEATHQEPKVSVCEKRYVFDAAPPENASQALAFNARGKCPVYRIDPAIADAVTDHRRQEQIQMAEYIAKNVATVPILHVDGGMNPVFASKLASHTEFDNSGHAYQVAGNAEAPGALPRTANPPAANPESSQNAQPAPASKPVVTASVPMPQPAPQAKEGEAPAERKPTTITSLLGNLFGSAKAEDKPTEIVHESREPRASKTASAKSKSAPIHTASAPAPAHAKPHTAEAPKPKAVAHSAPAAEPKPAPEPSPWPATAASANASPWPAVPAPRAQAAAKPEKPPAQEMRTAYAPAQSNGGLLSGAQPVVPAGSFASR